MFVLWLRPTGHAFLQVDLLRHPRPGRERAHPLRGSQAALRGRPVVPELRHPGGLQHHPTWPGTVKRMGNMSCGTWNLAKISVYPLVN